MGKFILDIPNGMHDMLRHASIDLKEDMRTIILYALNYYLTQLAKEGKILK